MALKIEDLKENQVLKDLTDDQLKKIAELSLKDEGVVIAEKTKDFWTRLDDDIFEITGTRKEGPEKTYEFLKSEWKKSADSLKTLEKEKTEAQSKIKDLEKKIADGTGDETLKNQIKDYEKQVKDLTNKISDIETANSEKLTAITTERDQLKGTIEKQFVDKDFSGAFVRGKDVNEQVFNAVLESAKREILANYTPEIVDAAQGIIQYRDKDGKVKLNPKNEMNPIKGFELLMENQAFLSVIDQEKSRKGTGGPPEQNKRTGPVGSLKDAKSQTEASDLFRKQAIESGKKPGTAEFETFMQESWNQNKEELNKLPVR